MARGRHSEIYSFDSDKAATLRIRPNEAKRLASASSSGSSPSGDPHAREPYMTWPVASFHDTFTRLMLKRKPGQELAKLEQETCNSSYFTRCHSSLSSVFYDSWWFSWWWYLELTIWC
jgi:hypothetical protein